MSPTEGARPTCDCAHDPAACLEQMFVQQVQAGRIDKGQRPARRPVFLRLHGVAHGYLQVHDDLDPITQVGLFAQPCRYPAWVRFSSDVPDQRPERKSTCGVGIKLFDVRGPKLLEPEQSARTLDLLFQNIDVFFVDNARQMCEFTRASLAGEGDAFLAEHPRTAQILDAMAQEVPSLLTTAFWSVIPFRLGPQASCKFKLEPETAPGGQPDYSDPAWLGHDLANRLLRREARFRLMVQVNPGHLPTDEATVSWTEEEAPPRHVATLVLPVQDIEGRGQSEYGERLAFNPWRTLPAHEPLGSIAAARKTVYAASAALRRDTNGEPCGEPATPRPPQAYPLGKGPIVRAAIHPAIGVARIGNAQTDYFIGPEVPNPPPTPAGAHRDETGAILRQAARFRVYGYDADGAVVAELGPANAQVTWGAHLVNAKAAWYQFDRAMDIPEAAATTVPLRNAKNPDRASLIIDPGPRAIAGASAGPVAFDSGRFLGQPVYLGELRTDEQGRLVVLGGRGQSGSPTGKPIYDPAVPSSFNNADGWYDDTADGPVTATVIINGEVIPCEPAWVVVAPPNYAPDTIAWRTLYDLRVATAIEGGLLPMPPRPSFTRHILPILERLSGLQWVNAGFSAMFGPGGPLRFDDPTLLARLARAPQGGLDPYQELRRTLANSFRSPQASGPDMAAWPWIYGDAFGTEDKDSPRQNLALPPTWASWLSQWVAGDFEADWSPRPMPPRRIDAVPLADQPATLDQAALHFCVADAFHPGCEVTWPMRHNTMFSSPFRIRVAAQPAAPPPVGSTLNQARALAVGGPLYEQSPGDLTRWMALPWQMDTAFCRSGYDPTYDPYLPTFWSARVPNQVLTEAAWRIVTSDAPREVRLAAFHDRASWIRVLPRAAPEAGQYMVDHFGELGIVERREGVRGDPELPAAMWVESLPADAQPTSAAAAQSQSERVRQSGRAPWALAGWHSVEELATLREQWGWSRR